MSQRPQTIEILRVPIAQVTPALALAEVERLYERDEPAFIAHTNAHTVNLAYEDPEYLGVLRRADLVLNDGKGMILSVGGGTSPGMPRENIVAMLEALEQFNGKRLAQV